MHFIDCAVPEWFPERRPERCGPVAQSCITQTLLCEPGAAQKAFALLTYWRLNGLALDDPLISSTINQMVIRHHASGFSSDIAWSLAFCIEQGYTLNSKAAQVLSNFDNDCIALQALHMRKAGLLSKGFSDRRISSALKEVDLDRDHWLVAYETVRHDFLKVCEAAVKGNALFAQLLKNKVTFYRTTLPSYAVIIHPGGAPEQIVRNWISSLRKPQPGEAEAHSKKAEETPTLKLIGEDLSKISEVPSTSEETILSLMEMSHTDENIGAWDMY